MAQGDGGFPAQQALGFDYDEGHAEQGLTALAGIPVLLPGLAGTTGCG